MKPLVLSMGASLLILGAAWAQNTGTGGSEAQLPVGQVFKNFEPPRKPGASPSTGLKPRT